MKTIELHSIPATAETTTTESTISYDSLPIKKLSFILVSILTVLSMILLFGFVVTLLAMAGLLVAYVIYWVYLQVRQFDVDLSIDNHDYAQIISELEDRI